MEDPPHYDRVVSENLFIIIAAASLPLLPPPPSAVYGFGTMWFATCRDRQRQLRKWQKQFGRQMQEHKKVRDKSFTWMTDSAF